MQSIPTVIGNVLILMGLAGGTIGAIFLGLDALGVSDLSTGLREGSGRLTSLYFVAYVNRVVMLLLVTAWAFGLLMWLTRNTGLSLILCPLAYFAWFLLKTATGALYQQTLLRIYRPLGAAVNALAQPAGSLATLLVLIPCAILIFVMFLLNQIVEFGIILPSFALGEFVIKPRLQFLLLNLGNWLEREENTYLRRFAFNGMIFLILGFLYQALGTMFVTISMTSAPNPASRWCQLRDGREPVAPVIGVHRNTYP